MEEMAIFGLAQRANRARIKVCFYGLIYYLCAVVVIANLLLSLYWWQKFETEQTIEGSNASTIVNAAAPAERTANDVVGNPLRDVSTFRPDLFRPVLANAENNPLIPAVVPAVASPMPPVPSPMNATTQRVLTLEEQEMAFYKKKDKKVNPYIYDVMVRPNIICREKTFMVILVHTHHPNANRRAAIRKSWGSVVKNSTWPYHPDLKEQFKLMFVLGVHKDPGLNDLVFEEKKQYDDIVQGNFEDSYRNLTLKSLLGLKLVIDFCPSASYLLKSDDDMFINVPYLLDVLKSRSSTRSIMGPLFVGSKVHRNGKWKLTPEEFPFAFYPPYEAGSAYIITSDILRELFETSEYVPSIHIDDVYITGILGKILNVTHLRQDGFAFWSGKPPTACDIIKNRVLTGIKMTPPLLLSTWEEINRNPPCIEPTGSTRPILKPPWQQ